LRNFIGESDGVGVGGAAGERNDFDARMERRGELQFGHGAGGNDDEAGDFIFGAGAGESGGGVTGRGDDERAKMAVGNAREDAGDFEFFEGGGFEV